MSTPHRYFIVNKPYNMVSQFVSPDPVNLLGSLRFSFPEGIHAIGRLDNASEGLLLLTTDKSVTRRLFSSAVKHKRTYLVQINNTLSPENLLRLQTGVAIKVKGALMYTTPPCQVALVENPRLLYPPLTYPEGFGPHTWLQITLTEGKFHQVRKMMNAIHHRCKRLIRISIEEMELGSLLPGQVMEVPETIFFERLRIDPGLFSINQREQQKDKSLSHKDLNANP